MKKIYISIFSLMLSMNVFGGEIDPQIVKLDVAKECDVKKNSLQNVLEKAKKYNKISKEHKLEYMRLGMKTSHYIDAVEKALKEKSKTIDIVDAKNKKTGTQSVEYGTWRACAFALSSLIQSVESKTNWHLAVPGDKYKY